MVFDLADVRKDTDLARDLALLKRTVVSTPASLVLETFCSAVWYLSDRNRNNKLASHSWVGHFWVFFFSLEGKFGVCGVGFVERKEDAFSSRVCCGRIISLSCASSFGSLKLDSLLSHRVWEQEWSKETHNLEVLTSSRAVKACWVPGGKL